MKLKKIFSLLLSITPTIAFATDTKNNLIRILPGGMVDVDLLGLNRTVSISHESALKFVGGVCPDARNQEIGVRFHEESSLFDFSCLDGSSVIVPFHELSEAPPNRDLAR